MRTALILGTIFHAMACSPNYGHDGFKDPENLLRAIFSCIQKGGGFDSCARPDKKGSVVTSSKDWNCIDNVAKLISTWPEDEINYGAEQSGPRVIYSIGAGKYDAVYLGQITAHIEMHDGRYYLARISTWESKSEF